MSVIELREPEFRRDPVTGRWVAIAPERALRPMALEGAEPRHRPDGEEQPCPFCPGREFDTPNEVFAIRAPGSAPDGPGWRIRVVPNKYPAVKPIASSPSPEGMMGMTSAPALTTGPLGDPYVVAREVNEPADHDELFESVPGIGRHEVVIESPVHVTDSALLPEDQFNDVFIAYRERVTALAADPTLRYAAVFKNVGAEAGASLGHCHSQIVATSLIPSGIRLELDGAAAYHGRTGRCVFCDIIRHELADGRRVIAETPHYLAVAPFAGRFAYEVWVLPKTHGSRYETAPAALLAELAGLMKRVVRALDTVLAGPAYNWFLHTAPLRSDELADYHWHFEIMPRTSRPAGFEWGTGCYITAVSPEVAAAELRAACTR